MSQLRIKQFTKVHTSSPYKGISRKVNISNKLLNALKEQSKSARERKFSNKYNSFNSSHNNYTNFSEEITDPKMKKFLKLYNSSISKASEKQKFVKDITRNVARLNK